MACQTPNLPGYTVRKAIDLNKVGSDPWRAFDYAIGSISSAQSKCPSKMCLYADIAQSIKSDIENVYDRSDGYYKSLILAADAQCTAAATKPAAPAPSNTTGGRVVQPEVKPVGPDPKVVDTSIPPAAQAGFSPWLLVGGLGVLVLLFGKKGKK